MCCKSVNLMWACPGGPWWTCQWSCFSGPKLIFDPIDLFANSGLRLTTGRIITRLCHPGGDLLCFRVGLSRRLNQYLCFVLFIFWCNIWQRCSFKPKSTFLLYMKRTRHVTPSCSLPSALWPPGTCEMFLLGGQRQTDGRWASSHFPSALGASSPVSPALSAVPAVTRADTVELFCFEPAAVSAAGGWRAGTPARRGPAV